MNLMTSLQIFYQVKGTWKFSTSKDCGIVKLIEKQDEDKRFKQNWRPISLLLNLLMKVISKAHSEKIKEVLSGLISLKQQLILKTGMLVKAGD